MQELLRDMLVWLAYFLGISLALIIAVRLLLRRLERHRDPPDR